MALQQQLALWFGDVLRCTKQQQMCFSPIRLEQSNSASPTTSEGAEKNNNQINHQSIADMHTIPCYSVN